MAWIKTNESLPPFGKAVNCQLIHCSSGSTQLHRLIRVDESDCSWRTADDHSEISFDWDVIKWDEDS